jgi:hypothetical protein
MSASKDTTVNIWSPKGMIIIFKNYKLIVIE